MKKTNLLLPFLVMFFGLSLVLSSQFVLGQNSDDEKEVKVKIVQKINGDSKTIERTFSAEDEAALKELLEEYDLNIDAHDMLGDRQVEISIRKSDNNMDDEDVIVKIHGGDADDAMDLETRAFLGVFVEDASGKGAKVAEVIGKTPAEKAGLTAGDIITHVNDLKITDSEQFREIIRSFKPGEEIRITYTRDGKIENATAELEEKLEHPNPFFQDENFEWNDKLPPMQLHFPDDLKERPFLGVIPAEQTENAKGVALGDVVENSTAQEIGLKKGDVITSINNQPVKNFEELRAIIKTMKPSDEVTVKYERDGKTSESSGKLKSKADRGEMCFKFNKEILPPCHGRVFENFERKWEGEISKESLQRKIERLEEELQELKEQLGELNELGSLNNTGKQTEETKITITIEDVAANNLDVQSLFFSPNPNNGKFNLSFELPDKGKTTVRIFDVNNKEIYGESLGKFSGRYDKQIDVSENPKGVYFLQITQDNKSLNKKIVIQ